MVLAVFPLLPPAILHNPDGPATVFKTFISLILYLHLLSVPWTSQHALLFLHRFVFFERWKKICTVSGFALANHTPRRYNSPESDRGGGSAMPPKYQKIAEELRIHILDGKYRGARSLPTEAALVEEYQVSRQTVRSALAVLEQSGLIVRRQGSGSYIRETSPPEAPASTRSVAVITTYISDYIFPSILREVETVLARHDCTPTLYATRNQVSNERKILSSLLALPVDGILVEGTKTALPNPNLDLYEQLLERKVPLVFMNGNYRNLSQALFVLDDNIGGGRMLVNYLHGKGHRSIAGIFKSDDIQGHYRYAGYAEALRDLGLPMEDRQVLWYNTEDRPKFETDQLTPEAARALEGCTAVVCYNDEVACFLIRQLMERKVSIPKDMAVVSFDNSQYSDLSPIRVTSLSHGENNVGRLSAELLIRLMQGSPCRSELVPWELVEKESS